jgi:hypothetical protein
VGGVLLLFVGGDALEEEGKEDEEKDILFTKE